MSKTRTITLTGRPPVQINEENWPIIAKADDLEHDGQVRSQANRESVWFVRVRQRDNGGALVYAGYDYSSNWQGERGYRARRGVLLPAGTSAQDICDAIREVCADISTAEGCESDRWDTLAAECIADMPAEDLG